ncbi:MAG: DUF3460 family protein [Zoogloeaceae bacterium]|jgi:hypothetical protein|nr:DUF3460 family protein [Zoogloeaceae bacterium]
MAQYESEHTQFMRDWLAQHPEELETQKSGRALWWDKTPQTPDEQRRLRESQVPRKAYYYT